MKVFLFVCSIFTLMFTLTAAVFTPATRAELKAAVDACVAAGDGTGCASSPVYGAIGGWNVSKVTDMSHMFNGETTFNQDIGDWDVSKVETMERMFYKAARFNQDIGDWDVSSVTDMKEMFRYALDFNQYIGTWDVSRVETMNRMFYDQTTFNQYIGKWDVSKVKNMKGMFFGGKFNQYIGEWDVSKVTDMGTMFNMATAFNKPLDGWYWVKSSTSQENWSPDKRALIPEESTVKCAPGKSYSASRPDDCSLCVVGQFQPDTVRNPENDVDCKECPVGTVPPSSSTACEPCPKGKYCANGIAQPCPAGEYQPLEGQTDVSSCKKCEIDHTSAQGSVVCERCPAGRITRGSYNVCIDYRGGVEPAPDALARSLRRAYKSLDQC